MLWTVDTLLLSLDKGLSVLLSSLELVLSSSDHHGDTKILVSKSATNPILGSQKEGDERRLDQGRLCDCGARGTGRVTLSFQLSRNTIGPSHRAVPRVARLLKECIPRRALRI